MKTITYKIELKISRTMMLIDFKNIIDFVKSYNSTELEVLSNGFLKFGNSTISFDNGRAAIVCPIPMLEVVHGLVQAFKSSQTYVLIEEL